MNSGMVSECIRLDCGCQSWILGTEEEKTLNSFELWCFRRMHKMNYTDKATNEVVLKRVGLKRSLGRHEGLLKTIIEGRHSGRPRLRYID